MVPVRHPSLYFHYCGIDVTEASYCGIEVVDVSYLNITYRATNPNPNASYIHLTVFFPGQPG